MIDINMLLAQRNLFASRTTTNNVAKTALEGTERFANLVRPEAESPGGVLATNAMQDASGLMGDHFLSSAPFGTQMSHAISLNGSVNPVVTQTPAEHGHWYSVFATNTGDNQYPHVNSTLPTSTVGISESAAIQVNHFQAASPASPKPAAFSIENNLSAPANNVTANLDEQQKKLVVQAKVETHYEYAPLPHKLAPATTPLQLPLEIPEVTNSVSNEEAVLRPLPAAAEQSLALLHIADNVALNDPMLFQPSEGMLDVIQTHYAGVSASPEKLTSSQPLPAEPFEWDAASVSLGSMGESARDTIVASTTSTTAVAGAAHASAVTVESLVDLRWFATGKLSMVAKTFQPTMPLERPSTDTLPNAGSNMAWTALRPGAQASTQARAIPEMGIIDASSKAVRQIKVATESLAARNGLSNVIAFTFADLVKRKVTVTDNGHSIDLLVRDYKLSETDRRQLVEHLTAQLENQGKTIGSFTFNGNSVT